MKQNNLLVWTETRYFKDEFERDNYLEKRNKEDWVDKHWNNLNWLVKCRKYDPKKEDLKMKPGITKFYS